MINSSTVVKNFSTNSDAWNMRSNNIEEHLKNILQCAEQDYRLLQHFIIKMALTHFRVL